MRNMTGLLKLESALIFIGLTALYFWLGYGFWLFVIVFFAPDISFAGYLVSPKVGAWLYNLVHFYGMAVFLALMGVVLAMPILVALGLILAAHIGFDRMLGYGLKHESGFTDTHLGRIGKQSD